MALRTDVYAKAVELLSRREHSLVELKQKLAVKFTRKANKKAIPGMPTQVETEAEIKHVIDSVCEQLLQQGYLSDRRFTESYINARGKKGFGRLRILNELQLKGVERELAEALVSEQMGSPELSQQLYFIWQKKFGEPPENYSERARQQRFLIYRGFSSTEIDKLFETIASDTALENAEDRDDTGGL